MSACGLAHLCICCPQFKVEVTLLGQELKLCPASICGGIGVLYGLNVICWKTYGTQPTEECCTMFHIFQNLHQSLPKVFLANCFMLSLRPDYIFFLNTKKYFGQKANIIWRMFFPNQTKCTNHIEINKAKL